MTCSRPAQQGMAQLLSMTSVVNKDAAATQGVESPPRATGVSSLLEQASLGVGRDSSREEGMCSGGPGEAQWVAGARLAGYACSGSCIPWRPRRKHIDSGRHCKYFATGIDTYVHNVLALI